MKTVFGILLALLSLYATEPLWTIAGLLQPESVIYDSERDCYYVSNINGVPNEKDGNGFISIVRGDSLVELRWVEGMDAPKGLTILGDFLYVTDIDRVHKINITTASLVKSMLIEEAKFLNDLTTSPEGDIYISDMVGGTIHRLRNDNIEPWLNDNQLPMPNGLLYHKGSLIVATWGRGMKADFTTDELGRLFAIDLKNKKVTEVSSKLSGNLDGVALKGRNSFLVSDYINGKIFEVTRKGAVELMQLYSGSADITYNKKSKLLFVPQMARGTVEAYSL